eukprot:GCRY01004414.1.p1 GENE.GCRY01004414.1~~GCRY01004414.1.p1  ORF type:complete len:336 (+),score=114.69 GCRY01004414.1:185-1192(+)
MPHMINTDIMAELQQHWPDEFALTASHQLRASDDMQYSFSYFYYLMEKTQEFDLQIVFEEELDTNKDGVLDRNEIRSLGALILSHPLEGLPLAHLHNRLRGNTTEPSPRPLADGEDYDPVLHLKVEEAPNGGINWGALEQELAHDFNISINTTSSSSDGAAVVMVFDVPQSPVSLAALAAAADVVDDLRATVTRRGKFRFQLKDLEEVGFMMVGNDPAGVVPPLDTMRKDRPKFICLNDNMDHSDPNMQVAQALHDFYEALFPLPSSFEKASSPPPLPSSTEPPCDCTEDNADAPSASFSQKLPFYFVLVLLVVLLGVYGKNQQRKRNSIQKHIV